METNFGVYAALQFPGVNLSVLIPSASNDAVRLVTVSISITTLVFVFNRIFALVDCLPKLSQTWYEVKTFPFLVSYYLSSYV